MDRFPTNCMPGHDVLVEMIKAQLDDDSRGQDFRRDVFLCLAVTIPPRQRARVKDAFASLLARARILGTGKDAPFASAALADDLQHNYRDDVAVPAELNRRVGVVSTLLVLGCQCSPAPFAPSLQHLILSVCA